MTTRLVLVLALTFTLTLAAPRARRDVDVDTTVSTQTDAGNGGNVVNDVTTPRPVADVTSGVEDDVSVHEEGEEPFVYGLKEGEELTEDHTVVCQWGRCWVVRPSPPPKYPNVSIYVFIYLFIYLLSFI